jgi:outer membrane protein, heavy metal efflux system
MPKPFCRISQLTLAVMFTGLLIVSVPAGGQEPSPSALPDAKEESGTLTLPDALALTLRHSPALAAFTWDIRAADAMIEQAGLRPNPELSVEIEGVRWTPGPTERTRSTSLSGTLAPVTLTNPAIGWDRETAPGARSGFSESELTISIAQPIELGRKRAKRKALAAQEKELVLWDYQAARADALAQTASDFVEVLAAQERVTLEKELAGLAEEVVRTFSLLLKAGKVAPIELSRAEVAFATTRISYEESQGELEAARAMLASNWGSKRALFAHAAGRLDELQPVPALDMLENQIGRNPDLARWSTELAVRQAEFKLERAQRIPDLTGELGFRSAGLADHRSTQYSLGAAGDFGFTRSRTGYSSDRDNSLVLAFSLPLPIFDRNQGRIKAAEAMISKVSEQRRGAEANAHAELASAQQVASAAYLKAQALRDEVMPKVDETFEKIQQGYREGKFGYLDVLDTQRTLFNARETFLDALTRYHRGVVRMERLTGSALKAHGMNLTMDTETETDEK